MKVEFNGKKLDIEKLSEGMYFLRKQSHRMNSSVRYDKPELIKQINDRLKNRVWVEEEIVVEDANMPFLNIL